MITKINLGQVFLPIQSERHSCVNYITLRTRGPSYFSGFGVLRVDMSVTSTYASFNYSDLPLVTYHADEVVLVAGSRTRQLLFLKEGAVAVVMRGAQIAIVDEPGAVFGEISALLDLPHAAEVRTLGPSQFHVADAALLGHNAAALFYVARILAKRLDRANEILVALFQSRGAGNHLGDTA
jgi:CRP-like cAMP-binding protein